MIGFNVLRHYLVAQDQDSEEELRMRFLTPRKFSAGSGGLFDSGLDCEYGTV